MRADALWPEVPYENLNARQKENHNYHHIANILAKRGFNCIRLSDDWQGADFLAVHVDGETLRVQLKGRWEINKKYVGKELHIAFPSPHGGEGCYVIWHDALVELLEANTKALDSASWQERGIYNGNLNPPMLRLLDGYYLE